jgi:hypothetical protein
VQGLAMRNRPDNVLRLRSQPGLSTMPLSRLH